MVIILGNDSDAFVLITVDKKENDPCEERVSAHFYNY